MAEEGSGFSFDGATLKEALKNIYRKDFNPMTDIEKNLFNEFWNKLNEATEQGFGANQHIEPEYEFLQALKYNNGVFAAFKTHCMQNHMVAQLLDADGQLKPFSQWVSDVQPIADHQCRQWFQTEYDMAVTRAHQAADWKQFEAEKDVLPNLEWLKSTSVHPGADHQVFWGTILPVNDPFWNNHRPGDRWGCKCRLRATDKPVNSAPRVSSAGDNPAQGLKNNPGITAQIFDQSHPYFQSAYKGAEKAVEQLMENKKPEALKYIEYKKYKNGGEVLIHPEVNRKGTDYKQLLTIANKFAKDGETVKITPSLHFKSEAYKQIYGALEGTPYYRKCPDLQVGNKFYEFESYVPPFKKEKISHMISHGAKQSPQIIINNSKGASDRYILHNILSRIKDKTFKYNIEEVWLYEKGKIRLFYKKTVGSK